MRNPVTLGDHLAFYVHEIIHIQAILILFHAHECLPVKEHQGSTRLLKWIKRKVIYFSVMI